MSYFRELDFPFYDLSSELDKLVESKVVDWETTNQICLNHNGEDSFRTGCGSLIYDWNKQTLVDRGNGNFERVVPPRDTIPDEKDFNQLCSVFRGTLFEQVYLLLEQHYHIGRIRLMNSKSHTCLSWHTDSSWRIHYPIKTQEGCFMIIEDQIKHLELNKWYFADTTKFHTAMNASNENRTHLVAVILGEK